MIMIVAAVLVILAAFALFSLTRITVRETSRLPQATTFQQRYIRDSHERAQWQMFTLALSGGTLPELQRSLK